MDSQSNPNSSSLWDFELILLSHNFLKKDIKGFSSEEKDYVNACIELDFKKVLNSAFFPNLDITKMLNLIAKVTAYYALRLNDNIETHLASYIDNLKLIYEKGKEKYPWMNQLMLLAYYELLGLFLKENWLGKSYLYRDADDRLEVEAEEKLKKLGMEDRIKKKVVDEFDYDAFAEQLLGKKFDQSLNNYTYYFFKTEEIILHRSPAMLEFLTVDGEEIFRKISFMSLFILLKEYVKNMENIIGLPLPSINLWKARLNFLHNKILNEKLTSLQETVLRQYSDFFAECEPLLANETEIKVCLKVEHGNVLLYYYKYKKSLQAFNEAQELRKLEIKITGMLGVRTKFQTFETAQLVVEATPLVETTEEQKSESESQDTPKVIPLEEDSVLLEKPKITDLNQNNLKKELTVYDQMIVLSLIYHLQKSQVKDEILQEQVSAYLRSIMDTSKNWLVYSMCLFVKSLNEFDRMKTKERSLLQLQTLIDQFNDKLPKPYERLKYYYSLYYPSYLELQKIMAEKYMEFGMVMSSSNLFEKLEMYEECVECLSWAGRREEAKQRALELIEKKPTAKIFCIYGELSGDVSYFKKAWKFSNKKFPRAKRSEATYWFHKGEYKAAVKAFKKALNINAYHASSWFTLGCAHLKLKEFHDAVIAFGKVVSIDESQGDAWSNMAAALTMDGKKAEAFSALQQAVKHHENSWRIWHNYMFSALENKKFKNFLESIERLANLQHAELIDESVLSKVNQVFEYHIVTARLEDLVTLTFYRRRISKLYMLLEDKLPNKPYFWHKYQLFYDLQREYNAKLKEIEEELNTREGLQQSYVDHLRTKLQERFTYKEIDESIADLCLKECHSIMVVGWEEDKKQCKMLLEAIERLKAAYKQVNDEKMNAQLRIFLDANLPTIQKTLSE